jgi:hypothetical protein
MLKKGSGIFVAEEKGVFPQSITVHFITIREIDNKWFCMSLIHFHPFFSDQVGTVIDWGNTPFSSANFMDDLVNC